MKDLSREYVQAIIDYGNISHAAKALYISQPYLSKFIKNLEQELGVEIINRKTTPVTLTYAGERYLYYMNKVENTVQKMQHEMQGIWHNAVHFRQEAMCVSKHFCVLRTSFFSAVSKEIRDPPFKHCSYKDKSRMNN